MYLILCLLENSMSKNFITYHVMEYLVVNKQINEEAMVMI